MGCLASSKISIKTGQKYGQINIPYNLMRCFDLTRQCTLEFYPTTNAEVSGAMGSEPSEYMIVRVNRFGAVNRPVKIRKMQKPVTQIRK